MGLEAEQEPEVAWMWMLVFQKQQVTSSDIIAIRNMFNKRVVKYCGRNPKLSKHLLHSIT